MAISPAVATKAGVAGVITAGGGGLVGTYYAWDHITLYEVERKVINTNLKLTASNPTNDNKYSTITAPGSSTEGSDPKLESGYSWSCKVSIDEKADKDSNYIKLGQRMQSHLQVSVHNPEEAQSYSKKLLVKACSKIRTKDKNDKTVTGSLTITKSGDKFTFKDHSYLDFLLENSLYEVEKKVISEKVALVVGDVTGSGTSKTIKINTKSGTGWDETKGNYWECTVTAPSKLSTINKQGLENRLPLKEDEKDDTKLNNKKILVQKCSDSRADTPTNTKVKATLDLSSLEGVTQEADFFKKLFNEK